jgi:PAS domain S-box-containing protein
MPAAMLFGPRDRSRTVAWAVASFAAFTALAFSGISNDVPLGILYVLSIALLAEAFELAGGLIGGMVASVAFAVWLPTDDPALPLHGALIRAGALIVAGVVLGMIARTRHAEWAVARAILDALPDPASVKDLSGRYLLVNRAVEEVLQHPVADIEGMSSSVGQPLDVQGEVSEAERRVVESGEALEYELTGYLPGIGPMVMRNVKAPVKDAQGRVVAIVTIAHDITARVRHEREVQQRAEQARTEYERATTDYARLIRHRWANPLTVIVGASETLRTPFARSEVGRNQLADLISEQVDRLASIDLGGAPRSSEERTLDGIARTDASAPRTHADGHVA